MLFFPYENNSVFGITKAEYREGIPYKDQAEKAQYAFIRGIADKFHSFLVPENVLILWTGIENEPYFSQHMGHSVESLLCQFAERVGGTEGDSLYIDGPDSLATSGNEGMAEILERLSILYSHSGIMPRFADFDFLEEIQFEELRAEDREAVGIKKWHKEMSGYYSSLFAKKFFDGISALLEQAGNGTDREDGPTFIREYFEWQAGKKSVKECAEVLAGVSAPSFYRYASEFEASPFYAEYFKAYTPMLEGTAKKGKIPDPIDFLASYKKMMGEKLENEAEVMAYRRFYRNFDEVMTPLEIPRVKLAAEKRVRTLKQKAVYKKAVEEHGYSLSDLP